MIDEFESMYLNWNQYEGTHYHDQMASVQLSFAKDVHSLVPVIEELGNPFEEESQYLQVLDTKEVAEHAAGESVIVL